MTTRRRFLRALAACTAVTTVSTYGQLAKKLPRIGVLALSDIPYVNDALRQGLREQGYIEGENIEIVYRSAGGNADRLPALVGQLMELNIDLIVAMGASAARAAKQATSALPIVMAPVGNPVEGGFVKSLARPGGNITGVSVFSLDLAAKRVALLKELLPRAERFAVLLTTSSSAPTGMMDASRNAARNLGVSVQFISIATSAYFDRAFESMKQGGGEGLIIVPSPLFNSERAKLSDLALKYRVPVVGEAREFAVAGFVLGYGPSIGDATRRSAVYVDKILKGAPPGELAIEQPAKFEMTINLNAAKALGLTIPPALLLRADEVIQ